MKKENHLEIDDGQTQIVSSKLCPLNSTEFKNQEFNGVLCCIIEGQPYTNSNYKCPYFYGAVFHKGKFEIDCRRAQKEKS